MTCIDIHSQREYDQHKNDKSACLHIVAGYIDEVNSGRVGRVDGSGRVGRVDGSGRVEWVDGSGRVEWVTGSGRVGRVDGSGSVGRVTGSGRVGRVDGSGRVGRVDGSGSVEWVDGSGRVGRVDGSGSVEWVDGSGRVEWVDGSGRVNAAGTSVVHVYSGTVTAAKYATVYQHTSRPKITGGQLIRVPETVTPAGWAEFRGIPVEDGHMVLIKAVHNDLTSGHGMLYPVGGTVTAPDFNTVAECGHGLHFSPHPLIAGSYLDGREKRYLACRVALADVIVLDDSKIKACSCEVLYEVSSSGDRLPEAETAAT
jgi:hypothetical protein